MEATVIGQHWQAGVKPICHPWISLCPTFYQRSLVLWSIKISQDWPGGSPWTRMLEFTSWMSQMACRSLEAQRKWCEVRQTYLEGFSFFLFLVCRLSCLPADTDISSASVCHPFRTVYQVMPSFFLSSSQVKTTISPSDYVIIMSITDKFISPVPELYSSE